MEATSAERNVTKYVVYREVLLHRRQPLPPQVPVPNTPAIPLKHDHSSALDYNVVYDNRQEQGKLRYFLLQKNIFWIVPTGCCRFGVWASCSWGSSDCSWRREGSHARQEASVHGDSDGPATDRGDINCCQGRQHFHGRNPIFCSRIVNIFLLLLTFISWGWPLVRPKVRNAKNNYRLHKYGKIFRKIWIRSVCDIFLSLLTLVPPSSPSSCKYYNIVNIWILSITDCWINYVSIFYKHTFFVTKGGPNCPSWSSLRKWSFFVTNTHFLPLTGVPTVLHEAAWESDHFSLQTHIFRH